MRVKRSSVLVLSVLCLFAVAAAAPAANIVLDTTGDVLYGMSTVSSSIYDATYPASNAVDGGAGTFDDSTQHDLIWALSGDTNRRLVVYGFNSELKRIRIYSSNNLMEPSSMTIMSSTNSNASVDATFETTLLPTTSTPTAEWTATDDGFSVYKDFAVDAPVGTQSIFFLFGQSPGGYSGLTRCAEVMGYATVPEPGAFMLLSTSVLGLLAYAWRKRR